MEIVIDRLMARLELKSAIEPSWRSSLVESIIRRESYGTSAIGKGLAFPHVRSENVDAIIGVIGLLEDGCDFGSLDDRPTRCVFLTISPIKLRREHGLLLERLFGFVRDQTLELLTERQESAQAIWDYVMAVDARTEADPV